MPCGGGNVYKMNDIASSRVIEGDKTIKDALVRINDLRGHLILFVVASDGALMGTVTDGDIRRALVSGGALTTPLSGVMRRDYKFLAENDRNVELIAQFREHRLKLIPVLDKELKIRAVLDLDAVRTLLPVQALIMAGGDGVRLRPLTNSLPKPLIPIGDKTIIEHNLALLTLYGIDDISISIRYLADKIKAQLRHPLANKALKYVMERTPGGTIGALSGIDSFTQETILVMNSDILTNINLEEFYKSFVASASALAIATVPYRVNVPYAICRSTGIQVDELDEKPSFTFQANAGIYLVSRRAAAMVPPGVRIDAPDFARELMTKGERVTQYQLREYWLDIGRPEDLQRATEDIQHLRF
jgi:dTDP-glucose pyrophosphorylase